MGILLVMSEGGSCMWKDYSLSYIKNNRSSSFSIIIATFLSALLLSLLCGLFYNMWKYEIERIELEEGGWQSRIIGQFNKEDIETIKNFANVKDVIVNEKEGQKEEPVIDIYFNNMKSVFVDMAYIAEFIGISSEQIVYNYKLLAMYFIRDKKDTKERMVFPMFIIIVVMASFSLIVIIHNSFAVSMNARVHQFGIFSSIGATKRQIRACLLQEAAFLCAIPIIIGNLLGIAGSIWFTQMANILLGSDNKGRHQAIPSYDFRVFLLTLLITVITIWISAWLPARKLSKITPLEAIKNKNELQLKSKKNSYLLAILFKVEGELAGNALKAQRKALRTASISLLFSFIAFTIMQCFFTLSEISTKETYFERYQDVWDIMVTMKDTQIDNFKEIEEIQKLTKVKSAIAYQKATAKRMITEEEISEEMKSFGGFSYASNRDVTQVDNGWLVNAPIIILDNQSFLNYCKQIGITPRLDGAVIRNQIRDVTNPDFRHPDFMPYIKYDIEKDNISILRQSNKEEILTAIPILSYTEKVPVLREEYATIDYYELVHFMPVALWEKIKRQIEKIEEDTYLCILSGENATLEELNGLQNDIEQLVDQKDRIKYENRIAEYEINNKQIQGIKIIFGGFCVLLAIIGISNVFSNTLGFVRQRKREFARYMSIGLTPKELRKMFCIEAFLIAGRPILITIPFAVLVVGYMLKMSYVGIGEFLTEIPWIPIVIFMAAILSFVAFAYSIAWKNVSKINLAEVLKDDTMI